MMSLMNWMELLGSAGTRLREARKAAGLSAAQVAKRAGMSESAIRALENGQNRITAENAAALAPIVKTTPTYILYAVGDVTVSDAMAEIQQLPQEELARALRLLKAAG